MREETVGFLAGPADAADSGSDDVGDLNDQTVLVDKLMVRANPAQKVDEDFCGSLSRRPVRDAVVVWLDPANRSGQAWRAARRPGLVWPL